MLLIWIILLWSFCVTNYLFMILFQNCYRYGCRCQYQNQRPILKDTRTTYFHIRPTTPNHFSETDGSLYIHVRCIWFRTNHCLYVSSNAGPVQSPVHHRDHSPNLPRDTKWHSMWLNDGPCTNWCQIILGTLD